jgi:tetratricopeptide (TPR) repeat protein
MAMRLPFLLLLLVATNPISLGAQDHARGVQLFESHDRVAARAEFSAALRENNRDARAHYYLGRLSLMENQPDAAVRHFKQAVQLDAKVSDYHMWYGSAMAQQVANASRLKQATAAGRVKAALERAVALDGGNIDARDLLVDFYSVAPGIMGGSAKKAREQAQAIARIDARRGHLALGRVAIAAKDTAAVEREMNAAIAAAPDSLQGYSALAAWYTRARKWPEAFAIMDRYVAKSPDDPYGAYGIARIAAESGQQVDRALKGITAFIANPPGDAAPPVLARAHVRLGQLLQHQGKRDEARAAFARALKLDARNNDAKKALAAE